MFKRYLRRDTHSELDEHKKEAQVEGKPSNAEKEQSKRRSLKSALRKAASIMSVAAALSFVAVGSGATTNPPMPEQEFPHTYTVRQASAYTESDQAMVALQKMYDPDSGLWNPGYWWNSANILQTVIENASQTHSTQYIRDIRNTYIQDGGLNFINQYTDDNGWWAITWIKAYDLTHEQKYLRTAKTIFDDMSKTWNNTCNGGVVWNKDLPNSGSNKSAISNELFLRVAILLHERIQGDTYYINWAIKEYNWFMSTGMLSSSNIVYDGLNDNCSSNGKSPWTYIQGEMIGALADLSTATHSSSYMRQAEKIANATDSQDIDKNGILYETACCYDGSAGFKGMYIQNLYSLYLADHNTVYLDFIIKNAKAIWMYDRNGNNIIGVYWGGPFSQPSASSLSSGIDALDAAEAAQQP